jgi:DNA-binding response OmpR family regulator
LTQDTNLKVDSARGRILFLDDNADTCEMVDLVLTQAGYKVELGCSVADGLRLTKAQQFDLILLDWHLADGTGIELCRAVREFDGQTPIFFYTGMAHDNHIRIAMQAGAQGCFIKPVEIETLLKTIAERVGGVRRGEQGKIT